MINNTFTAIDFETAQGKQFSICQVGLIRVENGIITKEMDILVQPPQNYYGERFVDIHGITPSMTRNAPTFEEIWHRIEPYIADNVVVAHNGIRFDFPVLSKTLQYYDLYVPDYEKKDTYKIYKNNLAALCRQHSIPLNHHDALSDARACAELYRRYLNG